MTHNNPRREMTRAEAIRAVRDGRLKRWSLRNLDQVIDDMASRAQPDWLATLDQIIADSFAGKTPRK